MLRSALFIAAAGLLICSSAQAQWKWKDAGGKVQYSDLPPPQGVPEKDILQRPSSAPRSPVIVSAPGVPAAPASAPASAASKPAAASLEQRLKEQNEAAAKQREEADKRKLAEQRRENCNRARESLRTLESGQRMTRTNDKGERVFLDDAQIAAEARRARDIASSECR